MGWFEDVYMYTHIINNHTYGSDLSMTPLSYGFMDNHNWMISSIILITVFPPSNSRRKAHTNQSTSLMLQSTFLQKVRYTLAYTPSQRTHITILVINLATLLIVRIVFPTVNFFAFEEYAVATTTL